MPAPCLSRPEQGGFEVQRIYESYLAGAGYKQIAATLTREGVPCPSANDRARNRHRPGYGWAMSAVRAILANPRYLGYHVSGRTKKADVLLDPHVPSLGHVTRQQWQDRAEWVTAEVPTYPAIVEEVTWQRVQALVASNTRTKAVTPSRRRTHDGTRRSLPSRYPLAGLIVCGCCGKKLQGNMARGLAFYRCKTNVDYPVMDAHPASLAVREDGLLPHVDGWLAALFAPEQISQTAKHVVEADAATNREDPAVTRGRRSSSASASFPGTLTASKRVSQPSWSRLASRHPSARRWKPSGFWRQPRQRRSRSALTKWSKPYRRFATCLSCSGQSSKPTAPPFTTPSGSPSLTAASGTRKKSSSRPLLGVWTWSVSEDRLATLLHAPSWWKVPGRSFAVLPDQLRTGHVQVELPAD
ncbi:MAG: recombinase family protein [Acidimicrobiales bacterium]